MVAAIPTELDGVVRRGCDVLVIDADYRSQALDLAGRGGGR